MHRLAFDPKSVFRGYSIQAKKRLCHSKQNQPNLIGSNAELHISQIRALTFHQCGLGSIARPGTHFSKALVTFRDCKDVLCLLSLHSNQWFISFESNTIKLSVNETKWTGLWARVCATTRAANNSRPSDNGRLNFANVWRNCNLGRTFCPANILMKHLAISVTNKVWLSYTLLFRMYLCVYVRPNFPFVRPKWCPSRTYVLSR